MCTCSSHLLQMPPWNYHKLRWNIHPLSSTSLLWAINPWFSSHGTRCMDQKLNLILFFHAKNPSFSRLPPFMESWWCSIFQLQVDLNSHRKFKHLIQKIKSWDCQVPFFVLLSFCCIIFCLWQFTSEATRNHLATDEALWRPVRGMS